jgi:hypothetical protein
MINGLESENTTSTILSNRTSTNTGITFFIHNYWGGSDHQMLSLRYNNTNWVFIDNGDFNGKLLDGDCHHVAVSKEGSLISFYIDGLLIGERPNQPAINIGTNSPIFIGNDGHSNDAFNGSINDVRIWNTARSASEIQEGIDNGVNPNENGLLGFWEMREGTGQSIVDATGQNDAVLGNSTASNSTDPSWGSECCDKPVIESNMCLAFDGENDYVAIPAIVGQSIGSGDFTLEAQISGLESENTTSTILSNRTSTNSGFTFFIHNYWGGSDHQMLSLRYNTTNWVFIDNGDFNGKLLDSDCHHVAVSKEGSLISFYIDGILIGERPNQPAIDLGTSSPVYIGNDGHSNDAFKGSINDVRIWNKARSISEIQDGIDNGIDIEDDGLIGYWEMREGSGQTIADATNQNDAVLGADSNQESTDPFWGNNCCGNGLILDIEDLESIKPTISLYPNPSSGDFTIDFKGVNIGNNYQYTLYDNMGRVIENNTLSSPYLDFKNIVPGHYFLQISNEQELIGVSKIIITQ